MRVVVVGASGNVGTALLRRLADDATVTSVVAVARRPPPVDVVRARDLPAPYDAARWVGCDLAAEDPADDPGAPTSTTSTAGSVVERLAHAFAGADAVVHLAWAREPRHDRASMRRTNVLGARRVTEAVLRAGVPHLVVASAAAVYSPSPDDVPRPESWSADGVRSSGFSLEKVALERLLDGVEHLHPGLAVARVRSAWVAQRAAGHQVTSTMLGGLVTLGRVVAGRTVPWPHGLRLQAVHADDLAAAYREIVVRRQVGAFNIAAPELERGAGIADAVGRGPLRDVPAAVVRASVAAAWHARISPMPPDWLDLALAVPVLDTGRARRLLAWSPTRSGPDALGELVAGMIDGAGTASPPLRPARGTAPLAF